MVRTVNATRVVDEIYNRVAELGLCYVSGDEFNRGKIKGLEEAIKIIGWIIHPEGRGWSSLFREFGSQ